MKRMLLKRLTEVSLALLMLCILIFIRSFIVADGWSWSDGIRVDTAGYKVAWRKVIIVQRGRVYFIADRSMGAHTAFSKRLDPQTADFGVQLLASGPTQFRFLGFEHGVRMGYAFIANNTSVPPVDITRLWVIPLWAITLVLSVLPALWLRGVFRAHRRQHKFQCSACGYDLRATPDRCPECGASPAASRLSASTE